MTAVCTTTPQETGNGSVPTSRLLASAGEMTLRIRGGEHDGRLLIIRSPKCTIGSAPGCTLRLQAAGVNPLSCWVLRGNAGTIVRRLHGPAALNGARFEEAALHAGDCLRIGLVDLEVVHCNEPAAAQAPLFPPMEAPNGELAQLKAEVAVLQDRAIRLEAECKQGFEASIMAAERADQLRDALAAAHEQLDGISRELAAAQDTVSQQADELDQKHRELDQLHATQRSFAEQLEEANRLIRATAEERDLRGQDRDGVVQERDRLVQERDGLVQERSALAQQRDAVTQERDALAQSRDALLQERDKLAGELGAARAAYEQQQEQFQQERSLLERRLAQRDAEIEALRSSSTAQTGAMTIAMNELTETQQDLKQELQSRCAELESQLGAKQVELDGLTRRLNEQLADRDSRESELQRQYQQVCGELAESRQQIDALRAASAAASDLDARQQSLARDREEINARAATCEQRERDLSAARSTLEAQSAEVAKARELWEHDRDELLLQKQEHADAQEELMQQRHRIEQQQEWLLEAQKQQESLKSLEAELQRRSADVEAQFAAANSRLAEIERLREELISEQAALDERRRQLDEREMQLESSHHQVSAEPVEAVGSETPEHVHSEASAVNCTAVWSAEPFAAVGEDSNRESGAAVQSSAEPPSTGAPAAADPSDAGDVDAVLGRLVRAGLWRSDEPAAEGEDYTPPARMTTSGIETGSAEEAFPANRAEPADEMPIPPTAIVPARSESAEEESIESYMERLMKRVRGDAPKPTANQPVAAPEGHEQSPALERPAQPSEEPAEQASGEYSPRRTAQELTKNLSAMRELANTAARTAIDRHVRQHTGKQAAGKLVGACLTVAASGILAYWAHRTGSLPAGVGSLIGGGVGVYWTLAAIRRLSILRKLNQLSRSETQAAEASPASPPSST